MVNHIDISIAGASDIRIPLAYGEYQNSAGTTIYTANEANHILTMTPDISISTEDMKNAVITASAIVDGERKELDDVFYITGYSQNDKTTLTPEIGCALKDLSRFPIFHTRRMPIMMRMFGQQERLTRSIIR